MKEYVVERSARKTLCLTIKRDGTLVVRAPRTATEGEIEAFVARHRRWIARRLADRKPAPALKDGSPLPMLGRTVVVAEGKPRLGPDALYLPAEGRERALASLCKKIAAERMERLTRTVAERYGFRYAGVRISSARSRWGSCNREGKIAFSFRTAFLPDEAALYVAVHELCHTRCFNHGPQFWREVGRILPDYAERRKLLRSFEWTMNFL